MDTCTLKERRTIRYERLFKNVLHVAPGPTRDSARAIHTIFDAFIMMIDINHGELDCQLLADGS